MRILDEDEDKSINNVSLFLEASEAVDLVNRLRSILEEGSGAHEHCNTEDYTKEITICLYTKNKVEEFLHPRAKKILLEDK